MQPQNPYECVVVCIGQYQFLWQRDIIIIANKTNTIIIHNTVFLLIRRFVLVCWGTWLVRNKSAKKLLPAERQGKFVFFYINQSLSLSLPLLFSSAASEVFITRFI